MTTATIYVTTTRYEGDDFPEAELGWPQFLADYLGRTLGCEGDVEVEYGPRTRVTGHPDADDLVSLIETDIWDEYVETVSQAERAERAAEAAE